MWGAGISMIHYGFLCDARLRTTYWTLMFCAAVTLLPKFRTPEYHSWKVAIYTSLGLTGLVFIIHGLVVFGWETQNRRLPLLWVAGMAVTNLVGALIFAARVSIYWRGLFPSFPALDSSEKKYKLLSSLQIPERWFPHKFDILGCSHQIFHIAVMVAACLHFATLVKASTSTTR